MTKRTVAGARCSSASQPCEPGLKKGRASGSADLEWAEEGLSADLLDQVQAAAESKCLDQVQNTIIVLEGLTQTPEVQEAHKMLRGVGAGIAKQKRERQM